MSESKDLIQDFYESLYKTCRGKVAVRNTPSGTSQMIYVGRVIDSVKRQKNLGEFLKYDNIKISIATYQSNCDGKQLSNRDIRDINAIVLKGKLPTNKQKNFNIVNFSTDISSGLTTGNKECLVPTFIVASDDIYFIYILNKNRYIGIHQDEARGSTIRFLHYIADGLCKELNMRFAYDFKPVKPTELIPIPGSTYVIKKIKRDENADVMYSEVIHSGIVSMFKIFEGKIWDIDELARVAGVPQIKKSEVKPKKEVKHSIKSRVYKSPEDMLRARLKLIEAVYNSFKFDTYDRKQVREVIFLYFNFSYDITKDVKIAERDSINAFKELFEYQGNNTEERLFHIEHFMNLPEEHIFAKKGYNYTDEQLFKNLDLTVEEAADFGYVKSNRKEYERQYNKERYAAKKTEKIANGTTREQKNAWMLARVAELLAEGKSIKEAAEILLVTPKTIGKYKKSLVESKM